MDEFAIDNPSATALFILIHSTLGTFSLFKKTVIFGGLFNKLSLPFHCKYENPQSVYKEN